MELKDILITILCAAIYLVFGFKIIKKAFKNIKRGEIFDENFLMVVASIGAICVGEWEEAIAVMVLYRIGEWLQAKAVGKSRKAITDLMDIRPDYANLLVGDPSKNESEKKDPSEIKVGDLILVLPGERVPLDGEVVEGSSRLDVAALTGESMPQDAQVGSTVLSGCINLDGLHNG